MAGEESQQKDNFIKWLTEKGFSGTVEPEDLGSGLDTPGLPELEDEVDDLKDTVDDLRKEVGKLPTHADLLQHKVWLQRLLIGVGLAIIVGLLTILSILLFFISRLVDNAVVLIVGLIKLIASFIFFVMQMQTRQRASDGLTFIETFKLGSLRDARLRVIEPIEVSRMIEGGKSVVEATELKEFGFGNNSSEAVSDLQSAIAELYFTLETERQQLGTRPRIGLGNALSRKVHRADAIACS